MQIASRWLVAATVVMTSCANPRSWVYLPNARLTREPVVDASLVVPPFLDARDSDNTSAVLLYLIPLMPFGFQNLSVPEASTMHVWSGIWQFKPADDLARSIAQEVDAARIFRESFNDPRASAGDYVLRGEVRRLQYHSKMFSYGLSIYGPLLWLFGFPASYTSNELELALTLTRKGEDAPLWTHSITGADSEVGWIYAGGAEFLFDRLLKDGMPAMLQSLEAYVDGTLKPRS